MPEVYLASRLDLLRRTQNPDGGWGYFPGKRSWLEPTAYAMLALQGQAETHESLGRAWNLVRSLRMQDGSYRPSSQVKDSTWVTALAVLLAATRGIKDADHGQSVEWLLGTRGAESSFAMRLAEFLHVIQLKLDLSHTGWPWRPGNAAWIEPTCHTLVALKKAAKFYPKSGLPGRVREGETMLLSRRCSDGGWNSGTPNVLNEDLPSYPETTAMALLGLQGVRNTDLSNAVQAALALRATNKSSLAQAWLTIALRIYGQPLAPPVEEAATSRDLLLTSLEALAHPAGNYRVFQVTETA